MTARRKRKSATGTTTSVSLSVEVSSGAESKKGGYGESHFQSAKARKPLLFVVSTVAVSLIVVGLLSSPSNRPHSDSSNIANQFHSLKKLAFGNNDNGSLSAIKFVTFVLPSQVDTKRRERRLQAIAETWAKESKAIFVVHNLTKEFPQAGSVQHEQTFPQILQLPGNITATAGEKLPRLHYVLQWWFQHYDNDHASANNDTTDFVWIVNDHTFVFPDKLHQYLQHLSQTGVPFVFAGRALMNPNGVVFNSNAAGLLMNRPLVGRLLEAWQQGHCPQDIAKYRHAPDVLMAYCLQTVLQIRAQDTRSRRSSTNTMHHRFHSYGLIKSVAGRFDDWYVNYHKNFDGRTNNNNDNDDDRINTRNTLYQDWDSTYTTIPNGIDCCSPETVSFHYVDAAEAKALHTVYHTLRNTPTMSDTELEELLGQHWPKTHKEVGGYSMPWPKHNSNDGMATRSLVMQVLHNMATTMTGESSTTTVSTST